MNYTIKEFRMIKTRFLFPGDEAAKFASDEDDRYAVYASQDDVGTLQPLIVVNAQEAGWKVIDGLGRLKGAQQHKPEPIDELPCLVVECDDPRSLSLHINSAGRKRSTGSRVLSYLLCNRERVMEACKATEQGGLPSRDGRPPQKGKSRNEIKEELRPWTINGISKKLGVCDKDVQMALELMICRDTLTYPSRATFGRYAVGESMRGDEAAVESLDRAYVGVMCGRTPVRRWAAAFAGRVHTAGEGKAATDWAKLAERTAVSLQGVFEHWSEAAWESRGQREKVEGSLAAALAVMPECCRQALMELIPQSWGPHEKAALAKACAKK